jgi:hypothetical protein
MKKVCLLLSLMLVLPAIEKVCLLLSFMLALPAIAAAETWNNVPMTDAQCEAKVKANPDAHTRSCALMCQKSGYGIVDNDGRYLKFDANGNEQVSKLLEDSSEVDHLRVNVSGTREGNMIRVASVRML